MANSKVLPAFLRTRAALVVSLLLMAQGVYLIALPAHRIIPLARPFSEFPQQFGPWQMRGEMPLEPEVQNLLKADDTMNRTYGGPGWPAEVNLFIAYFRSQRAGASPHSPKVCLPGSGWTPTESQVLDVNMPGRAEPVPVNHYVVAKGQDRSVVIYFYQSNGRVLADEYSAKLYSMFASTRYHRSDAAMVRVVVPSVGRSEAETRATALSFLRTIFPAVEQTLPAGR